MKSIIFIGTKDFGTSKEALTIAKEMNYFVILFTENKEQILKKDEYSDVDQIVYFPSIFDEKKVLGEIIKLKEEGNQVCACISFIDPYVSYSVKLAKLLDLVELSENALLIMENKIRVRDKLKDLPSSPFFQVLNHKASADEFIQKYSDYFPVVAKSPSSNGSKDVLFIKTAERFGESISYLRKKYPTLPILVEEYLLGSQFLIEVVVYKEAVTAIAVIEQEIINNGRFIVTGYKFPANLSDVDYSNLLKSIKQIIDCLGLTNGACHLEMRNVSGEWKLVEINPRMSGGAMNRIVEEGTGINLIKEILIMNLGGQPSLKCTKKQHVYAKYLTINSCGKLLKIIGKEKALEYDGVKYIYIKPKIGKILTTPFSMGNRYACIIATAEQPDQAKEIALKAAKEIKFFLESF